MLRTVKLGDVCELIGGGTPSKRNPKLYGGSIPWATVRDMHSEYLDGTEFCITEEGLASSSSNVIPRGNVIIASRVGLGKVCLLNHDTAINQDLRGVIPRNENEFDTKYLFYWFKSVAEKIISAGRGATVQGVTLPFLNALELPLPPLAEQQRIVAKLDAVFAEIDRAIQIQDCRIQETSSLKATMLVSAMENQSWQKVKLNEVCMLRNGRAYKKPELLDEGKYPVLRVGNFFTSDKWYYSDLELDETKYCDSGDLLYAWSASFGARIWDGGKVIYHYHIWRVDGDNSKIDKKFLFYWFEYDKEKVKAAHGTGTTMMHVSKGSMEKRDISLPNLGEQAQIVKRLDTSFELLEARIKALLDNKDNFTQLKLAILAQELNPSEAA